MTLQNGDYVLLNYTIIVKDENKIVQTTLEDDAKEAGIYSPDIVYEPRLVIIGETKLLEPVEKTLLSVDEGQEFEVEVPPEKAYGQRDSSKVKVLSIREFHRYGRIPKIGDVIEINNQKVRIINVSSGRVVLDFNHPLAGKTLTVKVKVVKKVISDEDKVKYIIKQYIPRIEINKVFAEFNKERTELSIKLPVETLLIDKIGTLKVELSNELSRKFNTLKKVIFIDEVEVKPKEEKSESNATLQNIQS